MSKYTSSPKLVNKDKLFAPILPTQNWGQNNERFTSIDKLTIPTLQNNPHWTTNNVFQPILSNSDYTPIEMQIMHAIDNNDINGLQTIFYKNPRALNMAIDNKNSINFITPFSYACFTGQIEIVKYLYSLPNIHTKTISAKQFFILLSSPDMYMQNKQINQHTYEHICNKRESIIKNIEEILSVFNRYEIYSQDELQILLNHIVKKDQLSLVKLYIKLDLPIETLNHEVHNESYKFIESFIKFSETGETDEYSFGMFFELLEAKLQKNTNKYHDNINSFSQQLFPNNNNINTTVQKNTESHNQNNNSPTPLTSLINALETQIINETFCNLYKTHHFAAATQYMQSNKLNFSDLNSALKYSLHNCHNKETVIFITNICNTLSEYKTPVHFQHNSVIKLLHNGLLDRGRVHKNDDSDTPHYGQHLRIELVKSIIKAQHLFATNTISSLLNDAIKYNNIEIFNILISNTDYQDSSLLQSASKFYRSEIVETLLKTFNWDIDFLTDQRDAIKTQIYDKNPNTQKKQPKKFIDSAAKIVVLLNKHIKDAEHTDYSINNNKRNINNIDEEETIERSNKKQKFNNFQDESSSNNNIDDSRMDTDDTQLDRENSADINDFSDSLSDASTILQDNITIYTIQTLQNDLYSLTKENKTLQNEIHKLNNQNQEIMMELDEKEEKIENLSNVLKDKDETNKIYQQTIEILNSQNQKAMIELYEKGEKIENLSNLLEESCHTSKVYQHTIETLINQNVNNNFHWQNIFGSINAQVANQNEHLQQMLQTVKQHNATDTNIIEHNEVLMIDDAPDNNFQITGNISTDNNQDI